jgi:hypothetical protein
MSVLPSHVAPPSSPTVANASQTITSSTANATPMPILYGDLIKLQGSHGVWSSNNNSYIDMVPNADYGYQFTLVNAAGHAHGMPVQDGDAVYILLIGTTPPQPGPSLQQLYITAGIAPFYYLAAMTNRDVQLYADTDDNGVSTPGAAVFYIRSQQSGASLPSNPTTVSGGSLLYGTPLLLATKADSIGTNSLGAVDLYLNYKNNINGDLNVGDPSGTPSLLTNPDYSMVALNPSGQVPYWIAPPASCQQSQSCASQDGGITQCLGSSGQWVCSDGNMADCSGGCSCTCGGSSNGTSTTCSQGTSVFPIIAGNCVENQCNANGCLNGNASPSCTQQGVWDCGSDTAPQPTATWKIALAIGAIVLVAIALVAAVVYYLRRN